MRGVLWVSRIPTQLLTQLFLCLRSISISISSLYPLSLYLSLSASTQLSPCLAAAVSNMISHNVLEIGDILDVIVAKNKLRVNDSEKRKLMRGVPINTPSAIRRPSKRPTQPLSRGISFSPNDLLSMRHQLGKSRGGLSSRRGVVPTLEMSSKLPGERMIWKLQVKLQSAQPNVRF